MSRTEPRWLMLLAGLSLLASLGLRFYDLDGMLIWHDEVYSLVRIFGIPHKELVSSLFDGHVHTAGELLRLQRPQPAHDLADTWGALREHPEHGPLYYLLGWAASHGIDEPISALRGTSVALSLLLFPALFWLARELFQRPTAWIALSLSAASPLWLLYAREARQYAFWLALVTAASAALVRAVRQDGLGIWGLYTALLILALYTHLLTAQVMLAHALFLMLLLLRQRTDWLRIGWRAGLAWTLVVIAFLPWLLVIVQRLDALRRYTGWMQNETSLGRLIDGWMAHLNRLFLDLPGSEPLWPLGVILLLVLLGGFLRHAPQRARLMLGSLMLMTLVVVVLPDLLFDGRRSLQVRYLLPLLLALQLMAAWAITRGLSRPSTWQHQASLGLLLLLLGAGFVSQLVIVQADTWWTKSFSRENLAFAERINRAERPLLIGSYHPVGSGELLSLASRLKPDTRVWLEQGGEPLDMPEDFTRLFALTPSTRLRRALAPDYRLEPFRGSWKWFLAVPHDTPAPEG